MKCSLTLSRGADHSLLWVTSVPDALLYLYLCFYLIVLGFISSRCCPHEMGVSRWHSAYLLQLCLSHVWAWTWYLSDGQWKVMEPFNLEWVHSFMHVIISWQNQPSVGVDFTFIFLYRDCIIRNSSVCTVSWSLPFTAKHTINLLSKGVSFQCQIYA